MLRFSGSPTINGVPRLVGRHRPGSMVRIRLPSGGESGAKPILSAGCEGASGIVGMELSPHMELGSVASDVMASAVPANEDPLPVASREVELEGSELG